jgi:hypothetical protein
MEGYEPWDIHTVDETSLFYNCLPVRILALKGQSCHGGKSAKKRVTLLLRVNSDVSDKWVSIKVVK